MTVCRIIIVSFLYLMVSHPAWADDPSDQTASPYFAVEGQGHRAGLPLKSTAVNVSVSAMMANVTVAQLYVNEGDAPINATYVFPASTRAAVTGVKMTIGQRTIIAEIREKAEARRAYDAARASGRSASLLEQERPNVFRMKVAHIMPGDTVSVALEYSELLVPEAGVYEFRYPTVVGPRYRGGSAGQADRWTWAPQTYAKPGQDAANRLSITGQLRGSMPISAAMSPSHQVSFDWPRPDTVRFELASGEVGDRDFVVRYKLSSDQVQSGVLLHQESEENFFLLSVQPPERVAPSDIPSREYVFVVDVSGSMHGFPLDTAKAAMRRLLSELRPQDRFNVILFAGGSRMLFRSSVMATGGHIDAALRFVEQPAGGGGTEMLQAIKRAMGTPSAVDSRTFVIVTDGYIHAEAEAFRYIRQHLGQSNFFAIGIGGSVNHHLIEGIARAGLAESFVISKPQEASSVVDRFIAYASTPVLTDIEVKADGVEIFDVTPGRLPDLLADRPLIMAGKWRGSGDGVITVTGKRGRRKFKAVIRLGDVNDDRENPAIKTLWARHKVRDIMDLESDRPDTLRSKILPIGLKYNLLTRFTSFIAVTKEVRNPSAVGQDVRQILPSPQGVDPYASGMEQGSEPGLPLAGAFLVVLIVWQLRDGIGRFARGDAS